MTSAPMTSAALSPPTSGLSTVVFESWPRILHSFSIVSHFHLLDLAQQPGFRPCFQPQPYLGAAWKPLEQVFSPADWATLTAIPPLPAGETADLWIRMAFPYRFSPVASRRLVVFMACDAGQLGPQALEEGETLAAAQDRSEAWIITPSQWSRQGLLRLGAIPERTRVVPHGVDPRWFRRDPAQRDQVRKALGWEGRQVLLSVGAMSGNKGVHHLAKAMAALLPRYPDLFLYLKGSDHTYKSEAALQESLDTLTAAERRALEGRIAYNGSALSFAQIALLHQAADLYVSPYSAEGFNMPVLEAMACGLPVVCTGGGATDDFTIPAAVKSIRASYCETRIGNVLLIDFADLVAQMDAALGDEAWRAQASVAGAAWVAEHYTWRHATEALLAACGLAAAG